MATICQQQTFPCGYVTDKTWDSININSIRQIPRQTHNDGDIGMVAFAGQRQRTVNINGDSGDGRKMLQCD